jgi:hypothetical protein
MCPFVLYRMADTPPADAAVEESPRYLQELTDECLLAVLQCCTDNYRTLFSASRAHSKLNQLAVLALTSIKAVVT